ncbi:MAG: ankyrin repeat domain-containing protein [Candidatus Babeliaceae bacterium]|jgi:hypothetical protein
MSLLKQKVITFFSIMLLCYSFITLSYPYRFQRLISLEKDGKTIKKCVDFIYDFHIKVPDFAKRPSIKKVKEGLLKVDEQHALSTTERTLLAALRTLNQPGDAKIDLLWEFVPGSEKVSAAETHFLLYGGKILSQESKDANTITFINSDTYRTKKAFGALFNLAYIDSKHGLSSDALNAITIKELLESLDAFFDDTPCDTNTDRQFCDLSKITDTEIYEVAKKNWLDFKKIYETKARPIFSNILQRNSNATGEELRQQLLKEKNLNESGNIATMYNFMANFEFIINVLSTSKKHVIVYAGGLHCEAISRGLQNKNAYGYNLIIDLGSNKISFISPVISYRAWDYLLETPLQSFNNYKRHGNRPFINIVTPQSDVFQDFSKVRELLVQTSNRRMIEQLQSAAKNIVNPKPDTKMLEQLQQFFKKADKTFVNFIEWRIPEYDNQTLLFATVILGWVKSTEFLLKHGARANVRDNKGQTPLFYAGPYPEIVKLLLAFGADVSVKNNNNQLIVDYLNMQKNTAPESKDLVINNKPQLPKKTAPKSKVSVTKDQPPSALNDLD